MTSEARLEDQLSAHRPYLLRFARRRLGDAALVEDVVQETLLAALQGAGRFERKSSLSTWLTAILVNRIADVARRARGEPIVPVAVHEARDADDAAEPVDWHDPLRLLEGRQSVAALGECLSALPALSARALTLRELDGLSNHEIARELGVTSAYCAVLLHRARTRLRDCVDFN